MTIDNIKNNKSYFDLMIILGRAYSYMGDYENTKKMAEYIRAIVNNHELYKVYICEVYYILGHVEALY